MNTKNFVATVWLTVDMLKKLQENSKNVIFKSGLLLEFHD
jgi:hypothetical protein